MQKAHAKYARDLRAMLAAELLHIAEYEHKARKAKRKARRDRRAKSRQH